MQRKDMSILQNIGKQHEILLQKKYTIFLHILSD